MNPISGEVSQPGPAELLKQSKLGPACKSPLRPQGGDEAGLAPQQLSKFRTKLFTEEKSSKPASPLPEPVSVSILLPHSRGDENAKSTIKSADTDKGRDKMKLPDQTRLEPRSTKGQSPLGSDAGAKRSKGDLQKACRSIF